MRRGQTPPSAHFGTHQLAVAIRGISPLPLQTEQTLENGANSRTRPAKTGVRLFSEFQTSCDD
jgi:hypothetical protein